MRMCTSVAPGLAQHRHDLLRRRAAHDRVVDDDEPLAADRVGQRVELQLHAAVAQRLRRLDERAADVVVLVEAVAVRDARLTSLYPCAAEWPGRRAPRSPCRPRPGARAARRRPISTARLVHGDAVASASRAARGRRTRRRSSAVRGGSANRIECSPRSSIRTISPGSTSRTERRADDVERARLGGDDEAVRQPADRQRPDPEGVARRVDAPLVHEHEAERALRASAARASRPPRGPACHRHLADDHRRSRGRCRWWRRPDADQSRRARGCSRGCRCGRARPSARRRS